VNDRALLEQVTRVVREIDPGAQVFLYGSRATGRAQPESDWDLLVLLTGPVSDKVKFAIRHRLYEIEWETGQVISTIIHSQKDWNSQPLRSTPFRKRVAREAVSL
jgi:predicted nucleotidyltransferase